MDRNKMYNEAIKIYKNMISDTGFEEGFLSVILMKIINHYFQILMETKKYIIQLTTWLK